MTKTSVIRCVLALLLALYLGFALTEAHARYAAAPCPGMVVHIDIPDQALGQKGRRPFVTPAQVRRLLLARGLGRTDTASAAIDTYRMSRLLNAVDNIESARVTRLADGTIDITVVPMMPVARVFDGNSSYYINRQGKRLTASRHFRCDVPVVDAHFTADHGPSEIMPLIDRLNSDSTWNALVSEVKVDPGSGDIILVPMIRGHVVNLGTLDDLDSKLRRILQVYQKVMPLRGWDTYDTLSVKWGGQVVATRRHMPLPEVDLALDDDDEADTDALDAMLTDTRADTVAAFKTYPGAGR